jgi:hypothetical protein
VHNPLFGMPAWLADELKLRQSGDTSVVPGVPVGSLADRAYRLVVARGSATAGELANDLGAQSDEVVDALGKVVGNMAMAGNWEGGAPIALVRHTSGSDTKFSVVDTPRMYV